jgi:hypothetical protein
VAFSAKTHEFWHRIRFHSPIYGHFALGQGGLQAKKGRFWAFGEAEIGGQKNVQKYFKNR